MNISFIPSIGWAGAALATALSTVGGLLFSYYYLNKLVDFTLPYRSVGAQVLAAMLMGVIVYGLLQIEQEFNVLEHNTLTVLTIVILGTVTYSIGLWAVSSRFRETVKRNIRFHQFIPDRFVD